MLPRQYFIWKSDVNLVLRIVILGIKFRVDGIYTLSFLVT
jgi:hypothetical protein